MHPAPAQLRNQAPRRRRTAGRGRRYQRKRLGWRALVGLGACGLVCVSLAWAMLARAFPPAGHSDLRRFDAIVVLGSRADRDGNPTPILLAHVMEGVKEYERGVAPRLIFTGGPTWPSHAVEARVMAHVAEAEGVPSAAIFVEPQAMDTIQNACFSERIMNAHGWRSAEVITIPTHAARSAMIFDHTRIQWRMHTAPLLEPGTESTFSYGNLLETLKTVRYLLYAQWADKCAP